MARDRKRVSNWLPRSRTRIFAIVVVFFIVWWVSARWGFSTFIATAPREAVFSCPPEPAPEAKQLSSVYSTDKPSVSLPRGVPWFWGSRNPGDLSRLCTDNVDKAYFSGLSGQWADGKERYVIIRFLAGFNNVRLQLEQGLFLAYVWGVTLVTPKYEVTGHNDAYAGEPHRSVWETFDIEVARRVVKVLDGDEWDRLLASDASLTPKEVPTVAFLFGQLPANDTVEWSILDNYYRRKAKYYVAKSASIDSIHNVKDIFGSSRTVYLSTPLWDQNFFWQDMLGPIYYNCFRLQYLQAVSSIQEFALSIVNQLGTYSSVQLRRDDFPDKTPSREIVKHIRRMNVIPDCTRLYLATDQKDRNDLAAYYTYFHTKELRKHFADRLPPGKLNDFLMVAEQIICAYAKVFVGTHRSSVTEGIVKLRSVMPMQDEPHGLYFSWDLHAYYAGDANTYVYQILEHFDQLFL